MLAAANRSSATSKCPFSKALITACPKRCPVSRRFETKAKDFPGNIPRAATELARDWRTDRVLRKLEAMMVVINAEHSLLVTGQGDVVSPQDGIIGIAPAAHYGDLDF